jgi:hypothetical protein
MKLFALAVGTLLALGGCAADTADSAAPAAAPVPASTAGATASPSAASGMGSVKDAGDIPDPCTLLTNGDVVDLTARDVTTIDHDGEQNGASTRYCQWQQDSGQLAVFLSRTTEAEFESTIADAQSVDGVGQQAYANSGHLYVLYGSVNIDVYSHGDSEQKNLEVEIEIAKVLIPKI